MKLSTLFVSLLAASSFLFACSGSSDGGGGGTGTDTSKTAGSSGSSGSPSSSGSSSSQSCSSASLNGQCTDGPKKGSSCCYAPSSDGDPPCASSNECSSVCRHCE